MTVPSSDSNAAVTSSSTKHARVYERPSAFKRLWPRILLTVVLMIVSLLLSWWLWTSVF
ncbi:MAG TPA: hypothetical protein VGN72_22775 [Tepidisphaeraceae bacterium]|jgi:hypothetical protein|nr:hypothetical protein [Tepidisphaeraceae bacterium]